MNLILEKNYVCEAAIAANRIVKFGATDGSVAQGAAAADLLVGVMSSDFAAVAAEKRDIMRMGIAQVKLGGTVTRGQQLTSDASGQAVAAVTGNRVIGIAEVSGVIGDVIDVAIEPGVM